MLTCSAMSGFPRPPRLAALFAVITLLLMPAAADSFSLDLGDTGGTFTGRLMQTVLLLSVLSVAPALIMTVTSFTRFLIVFGFLRSAIGTHQSPPNMVMSGLALFLTVFVMQPVFERAYEDGLKPMMEQHIDEQTAFERIVVPFHDFMEKNTRPADIELFMSLRKATQASQESQEQDTEDTQGAASSGEQNKTAASHNSPVPITVLIPAFMISELRRAFEIGFLLFLPFLIIDLVTAGILMSMGMMMLPPVMISLPFKIIFFVLIDGWRILCGSLVNSYAAGSS